MTINGTYIHARGTPPSKLALMQWLRGLDGKIATQHFSGAKTGKFELRVDASLETWTSSEQSSSAPTAMEEWQ